MNSMSSPCHLPTCACYNESSIKAGFGIQIRLVKELGMRYAHLCNLKSVASLDTRRRIHIAEGKRGSSGLLERQQQIAHPKSREDSRVISGEVCLDENSPFGGSPLTCFRAPPIQNRGRDWVGASMPIQGKPKSERALQAIGVGKEGPGIFRFCQQSAFLPSAKSCNLMQARDSEPIPALMAVSLHATTSMLAGDAVMIVDHGSRRPESNVMLHEFVELYKQKTSHTIVEPAHMELAEPSIGTAFNRCVEQGATRVIISPYFLFPGRHWDKDIPALAAQAAEQHTGVPYIVTAPIGLHELMVRVVEDRMQYCVSHAAGNVAECSMCAGTGRCQQLTSNPRPTISTNSSNK